MTELAIHSLNMIDIVVVYEASIRGTDSPAIEGGCLGFNRGRGHDDGNAK